MSRALIKYIRLSPTKARLIAREIQGMNAELAMASLKFMPNKGAKFIANAISSAVANGGFEASEVSVISCRVDAGSVLRRFTPRARGSASRIRRPTSHILVEVGKIENPAAKAKKAVNSSENSAAKKAENSSENSAAKKAVNSKADSAKKAENSKAQNSAVNSSTKTAAAKKAENSSNSNENSTAKKAVNSSENSAKKTEKTSENLSENSAKKAEKINENSAKSKEKGE